MTEKLRPCPFCGNTRAAPDLRTYRAGDEVPDGIYVDNLTPYGGRVVGVRFGIMTYFEHSGTKTEIPVKEWSGFWPARLWKVCDYDQIQ